MLLSGKNGMDFQVMIFHYDWPTARLLDSVRKKEGEVIACGAGNQKERLLN